MTIQMVLGIILNDLVPFTKASKLEAVNVFALNK